MTAITTPTSTETDIPEATETEKLKAAAAAIDRLMDQGGIVEIDAELADFMGITVDNAVSDEDALEAHLYPYGRDGLPPFIDPTQRQGRQLEAPNDEDETDETHPEG